MSLLDDMGAHLGPVQVCGRGLVTPKGWISPETRALMAKAQEDCARDAEAREAATAEAQRTPVSDAPTGFVIDPFAGQR